MADERAAGQREPVGCVRQGIYDKDSLIGK
jgi:hypothetical protein